MQHSTLHTTAVQSPSHYQWYILTGKQWYQLPEFIPSNSNSVRINVHLHCSGNIKSCLKEICLEMSFKCLWKKGLWIKSENSRHWCTDTKSTGAERKLHLRISKKISRRGTDEPWWYIGWEDIGKIWESIGEKNPTYKCGKWEQRQQDETQT